MNIKYFVVYDDNYNVVRITTEVNEAESFFEIDKSEAVGFSIGTKSLHSYYVKRSPFNIFSLEEKKFNNINYIQNEIVEISSGESPELLIEHNLPKKQWKFYLQEKSKNLISKDQLHKILKFYIVQKNQPNNLFRTLELSLESLINSNLEIDFVSAKEEQFNNFKIITKRYFDTIGIKYE